MPTKKALEKARAEYATSLRQLAGAALHAVERPPGPLVWSGPLEKALDEQRARLAAFRNAYNADCVADLAKLPEAK